MNNEQNERILADFRNWLNDLSQPVPAVAKPSPVSHDAIVAQFTALRHEVNLQTKAARALVEQVQQQAAEPDDEDEADDEDESVPIASVVKLLLDLHDALSIAHRQVQKLTLVNPVVSVKPQGFFARFFRRNQAHPQNGSDETSARFAAAADGYAMSLRRIDRALQEWGLEPIACVGERFDPEFMEVVDLVSDSKTESGCVIEVVRNGYLRKQKVIRYAQVQVAR